MVFLMKMKLKTSNMVRVRQGYDFDSCLAVDCIVSGKDRTSGLGFLWRIPLEISIYYYSPNHIGVFLRMKLVAKKSISQPYMDILRNTIRASLSI